LFAATAKVRGKHDTRKRMTTIQHGYFKREVVPSTRAILASTEQDTINAAKD
jgi:hypothetical protein